MAISEEAFNSREWKPRAFRRSIYRLAVAAGALGLLLTTSEALHIPDRSRTVAHNISRAFHTKNLHPLPNLAFEQVQFSNDDEKAIYNEVGLSRAKVKPLPVIQNILAISNDDLRKNNNQITFAIANPVLVKIPNGKEYVVGHSGRTADSLMDLVYSPLEDTQFCGTDDSKPSLENIVLGNKLLTHSFEAQNAGYVEYVYDNIVAGCQRLVPLGEIYGNTASQPA